LFEFQFGGQNLLQAMLGIKKSNKNHIFAHTSREKIASIQTLAFGNLFHAHFAYLLVL